VHVDRLLRRVLRDPLLRLRPCADVANHGTEVNEMRYYVLCRCNESDAKMLLSRRIISRINPLLLIVQIIHQKHQFHADHSVTFLHLDSR
jgi:hypothetical protein